MHEAWDYVYSFHHKKFLAQCLAKICCSVWFYWRGFLSSPLVKTLSSNAGGTGSIPIQGTKIPPAGRCGQDFFFYNFCSLLSKVYACMHTCMNDIRVLISCWLLEWWQSQSQVLAGDRRSRGVELNAGNGYPSEGGRVACTEMYPVSERKGIPSRAAGCSSAWLMTMLRGLIVKHHLGVNL